MKSNTKQNKNMGKKAQPNLTPEQRINMTTTFKMEDAKEKWKKKHHKTKKKISWL